jgi:flavin reductase (DIM6/NTAB) family NADH-FMN oxidoreductase RutF
MATVDTVTACDYIGLVSGNKEPDKFAKAGFSAVKSQFVNAPIINELPMTLECELLSYDEESNHLVGRIVNISAEESILTDGKIDIAKLRPITYDPIGHNYFELGAKVGNAFSDGKKLK